MLLNPAWNKPSFAGFELWFGCQGKRVWDYSDMYECPLGQYYKSCGLPPKRFADELFDSYAEQCRILSGLGVF